MSWLVDNANGIYVLLGILAAGLVVLWRFNGRVKFLGYAAGVLVLLGLFWLLTQFVVTDAKQLESNVRAMGDAIVAGNVDDIFKHVSNDFDYKGMNRNALYEKARAAIASHRVKDVRITQFTVAEVSRVKKFAKTRFRVAASADREYPFITEADFVLEGKHWKLKTMRFYDPVRSLEEVELPGMR